MTVLLTGIVNSAIMDLWMLFISSCPVVSYKPGINSFYEMFTEDIYKHLRSVISFKYLLI